VAVTLVVVIGLALGAAGAHLLWRDGEAAAPEPQPSAARVALPEVAPRPGPRPFAAVTVAAPASEPATARDALDSFLRAHIDRRGDVAYALITADGRRRFPSLSTWQTGAVDRLVPRSYELGDEREAEVDSCRAVDIDVHATHDPALDTFNGLVPGRALERWRVWYEDGHWRVDPDPVRPRRCCRSTRPPKTWSGRGWRGCTRATRTAPGRFR
jgi:hypothetical protein